MQQKILVYEALDQFDGPIYTNGPFPRWDFQTSKLSFCKQRQGFFVLFKMHLGWGGGFIDAFLYRYIYICCFYIISIYNIYIYNYIYFVDDLPQGDD